MPDQKDNKGADVGRDRTPEADSQASEGSLRQLRTEAADCRTCDLWMRATQTVFGEGGAHAKVMFVGEQPGDQEDLSGRPFVGPAGKLLGAVLKEIGIDRKSVYVTNAVKHFSWEPRGKRRIHKKPRLSEIAACRPWLLAEIAAIKPKAIICLGATAAQSLLGAEIRVTRDRGVPQPSEFGAPVMVTVHPASILRMLDSDERDAARVLFRRDLEKVLPFLK